VLVESGATEATAEGADGTSATSAASQGNRGVTIDAACKVADVVGTFSAGVNSKSTTVARINAKNVSKAMHVGVLASRDGDSANSMLCMLGVTTVKIVGPAAPNNTVYADLSDGKNGAGTTTKPTTATEVVVLGQVLSASPALSNAASDAENNVMCVISSTSTQRDGADEQTERVTTAKLNFELNKKIADQANDGGADGLVDGVARLKVKGPAAVGFKKASGGLEEGTVAVLCSHASSKMLQFGADSAVDARRPLTPSAMLVVVRDSGEGADATYRLQHAEDDASWLRVGKDGAIDGAGNPDTDETLFTTTIHETGAISLTSVLAGKVIGVRADGGLELLDDAAGAGAKFTPFRREMAL